MKNRKYLYKLMTVILVGVLIPVLITMIFVSNVLDQKYGDTLNISYILKKKQKKPLISTALFIAFSL